MTKKSTRMQWYRVDLHLHTPASLDYHDPHASYLEILRRAEYRGLDIIAFTDHNTVGGYVFGALGRRPEVADVIEAQGCRLVVEALDGMRVSRLRIALEQPAPTPDTSN